MAGLGEGDLELGVRTIIAEHLGHDLDKVTLDSDLTDDLGADSLHRTDLAMLIEEEYDIDIPDEVSGEFNTPRDYVRHVRQEISKKPNSDIRYKTA